MSSPERCLISTAGSNEATRASTIASAMSNISFPKNCHESLKFAEVMGHFNVGTSSFRHCLDLLGEHCEIRAASITSG